MMNVVIFLATVCCEQNMCDKKQDFCLEELMHPTKNARHTFY